VTCIISTAEVQQMTSLSRTTLWRLERDKKFPARRKLTAQRVGWVREEVEEWLKNRPQPPFTAGI